MPVILDKQPEEYTVQADDTLASIAQNAKAKHGDDVGDWKLIARYNWGTDNPRDVVRALAETIGVKLAADSRLEDWDTKLGDPEKIKLAPDADLTPKLKIPKPFKKEGLALDKTHTLKLKPAPTPANAVSILTLDKWFIPKEEECEIKLRLGGEQKYADRLQLDVYGSNYCECTDWNKGRGKYGEPSELIDVPVMDIPNLVIEERQERAIKGWKGEVSAEKGMLSRKTGKATDRYINVSFSPYTVHFRYFKADGDEKARLILEAFWPQFEETPTEQTVTLDATKKAAWSNAAKSDRGAVLIKDKDGQRVHLEALPEDKLAAGNQEFTWSGNYRTDALNSKFGNVYINEDKDYKATITTFVRKLKDDSLKIKWEFKHTAGKLERGLLQITDGAGKLIFQKALVKGKLGDGKQEFQWDGKYAAGIKNSKDGDKAIPEDMPYRVQIQAHTGANKPEGLALAAMHTEVRLYVHKKNVKPKDLLYDPWNAQKTEQSLVLARGSYVAGDPPNSSAGTRWFQYQLVQNGFHPGPVNGTAHDPYKMALKEFKRSVPKRKTGADYERLDVDESESAATKEALEHFEAKYKRSPFGNLPKILANNDDPDMTDDEVKSNLPNPTSDVVVWVDDRQYYTSGDAAKDDGDPDGTSYYAPPFNMGDYRGQFNIADARVTRDSESISRPWIPLQVGFKLLSREKGLYDEVDDPADEKVKAAMSGAVGPLRVDWTFDELPPDISTIDPAAYDSTVTRSRKYVAWALANNKATHRRKDTDRDATYTNCKEDLGGIRPAGLGSYHQQAFGTGDLKLEPWEAAAVADTESIATVVHDHIAKSQKDKTQEPDDPTKVNLFEPLLGTAGAYFNPSRIAGDGYRVRAEVQFKKFTDYEFPNLEALEKRYPTPPQAHTARLRLWRRSSIRGYMCWAAPATGHWPALLSGFRAQYRGANLYFVHEAGATHRTFNVTDVFDPATAAHATRYKKTIRNNVDEAALKDMTKMSLRAADVWPWGDQADLGLPAPSPVNLAFADFYDKWISPKVLDPMWRKFRAGLLLALLKEVEKKGFLRGHLFVEFESSPEVWISIFQCDAAANALLQRPHVYHFLRKKGSGDPPNRPCPAPGCGTSGKTLGSTNTGYDYDRLPLPAVGCAFGATWLFTTSDADTWAHEVGHHRHLEHAASGPGSQYKPAGAPANADLHDNEGNSTQNWTTFGVINPANDPGTTDASEQDWDRNCIMSYSSSNYPANRRGRDYFCGKCLLRNRGWKVQGLGYPGPNVKEP